jgi:ketosteroid isomerase-like protein
MRTFFNLCIISILLVTFNSNVAAQDWSSEQQDVWKNVEAYWDLAAKGDLDGFVSYFHESFMGWNYGAPATSTKSSREKLIKFFAPQNKTLFYNLTPVGIWVQGEFAFVDYHYMEVTENKDGKRDTDIGRWTDILIKDGDRWIMIGDHGGRTNSDD